MTGELPIEAIYVEDDNDVRAGGVQALKLAGFEVRAFASAEAARSAVHPDVRAIVVCDVKLGGISGLGWAAEIRGIDSELPVILITGHGDIAMAVQAMRDGAYDFIEKPCVRASRVRDQARGGETSAYARNSRIAYGAGRSACDQIDIARTLAADSEGSQARGSVGPDRRRCHDLWRDRDWQGMSWRDAFIRAERATQRQLCCGQLRRPA